MSDLIDDVELRRQVLRLSQAQVASAIGASQGQFSKVMRRKVSLTPKMSVRLSRWLSADESASIDLDREILQKCMELMHLVRVRFGVEPGRGAPRSGE